MVTLENCSFLDADGRGYLARLDSLKKELTSGLGGMLDAQKLREYAKTRADERIFLAVQISREMYARQLAVIEEALELSDPTLTDADRDTLREQKKSTGELLEATTVGQMPSHRRLRYLNEERQHLGLEPVVKEE